MAEIVGFTDLKYGDHQRQKIDVFRPAGEQRAPFVILVHGGAWAGGSKEQYRLTCLRLAEAGIACASVGYRLLPDAAWPEMPWDVARGASYLVEHSGELGVDASRAVTWGSSAGGHLALMYQARAKKWAADGVVASAPEVLGTVAQCPAVEFFKAVLGNSNYQALMNGHSHEEVGPAHVDPKLFRGVLLAQGDTDEVTPIEHARAFIERLKAASVDARLEVIPGAVHGYGYDTLSEHSQACLAVAIPYVRGLFSR